MATMVKRSHPLWSLNDSDLELVMHLVLTSGSLKELAQIYGVSYPTIRSRLDQLIKRLRDVLEERESDAMIGLLDELVAKGEVTASAAQAIVEIHRREPNKRLC
jgi:hypothetical protein